MKLRPFNGRSEIRLSVSIVPRDEVSVCSKGAVAVTSTDSVVEPTCRVRFTRTTWLTPTRSEEHTSELQSRLHLVCRLLLEKKKKIFSPIKSGRSLYALTISPSHLATTG